MSFEIKCALCGEPFAGDARNSYCSYCKPLIDSRNRIFSRLSESKLNVDAYGMYSCLKELSLQSQVGICQLINNIRINLDVISKKRERPSMMGDISASELVFKLIKKGYL